MCGRVVLDRDAAGGPPRAKLFPTEHTWVSLQYLLLDGVMHDDLATELWVRREEGLARDCPTNCV